MMTCGWVVHNLQSVHKWDNVRAYRMIFFAYAAVGVIKFCLTCALSKSIEAEKRVPRAVSEPANPETALLLPDGANVKPKEKRRFFSLIPDISTESRLIVVNLCVLFALDSFASGLAPL